MNLEIFIRKAYQKMEDGRLLTPNLHDRPSYHFSSSIYCSLSSALQTKNGGAYTLHFPLLRIKIISLLSLVFWVSLLPGPTP